MWAHEPQIPWKSHSWCLNILISAYMSVSCSSCLKGSNRSPSVQLLSSWFFSEYCSLCCHPFWVVIRRDPVLLSPSNSGLQFQSISVRWLVCWFDSDFLNVYYIFPLSTVYFVISCIFSVLILQYATDCLLPTNYPMSAMSFLVLSNGGSSCSSVLFLKLLAFAYKHLYLCFVPILGTHLNNTRFPVSYMSIYILWPVLQNFRAFLFSSITIS